MGKGLEEFLIRQGVKPTGCSRKDIEKAREFLPERISNENRRKNKKNGSRHTVLEGCDNENGD